MTQTPDIPRKIAAFLQRKGVAAGCPRCGSINWGVHENWPYARIPVTGDILTITDDKAGIRGFSPHADFPAYMLYCTNCGFVTLHMQHIVDAPEGDENKEPDNE